MMAAIKYCKTGAAGGAPKRVAIINPAKIPKPPNVGITAL